MKYLYDKVLQDDKFIPLDDATEETETGILVELIHGKSEEALKEFLLAFIRRTQDPPLVQSMAKLIQLLVGDAPISSVVPFMYHHHHLDICSSVIKSDTEHNNLQKMIQYGIKLHITLQIAITNGFGITCAKFYQYLLDQVVKVHAHDRCEPK